MKRLNSEGMEHSEALNIKHGWAHKLASRKRLVLTTSRDELNRRARLAE